MSLESLEHRNLLAIMVLDAVADNTLYEDATGSLSNGGGENFFVGRNLQELLARGLVRFDVAASIPAGSRIDSATLSLHMSRTAAGTEPVTLHRVSAAWGEGSSDAPTFPGRGGGEGGGAPSTSEDATWLHRMFPDTLWDNAGGDFAAAESATSLVGQQGSYDWTSDQLRSDVQQWLDDPASNFGWLVHGNEGTSGTTKRFDTRENPVAANRPKLTVEFNSPPQANALIDRYTIDGVLLQFSLPSDTFTDPDVNDVLALAATLSDDSPLPAWLQFDGTTATFDGTPEQSDADVLGLRVTATDLQGLTAESGFRLVVARSAAPWQSPIDGMDVNLDGFVSAVADVLPMINELNQRTIVGEFGQLPSPPAPGSAPPQFFLDVSGDNLLSAVQDVLPVINHLNAPAAPEPDGEAFTQGEGFAATELGAKPPSDALVPEPAGSNRGPSFAVSSGLGERGDSRNVLAHFDFQRQSRMARGPAQQDATDQLDEDEQQELLELIAADAVASMLLD